MLLRILVLSFLLAFGCGPRQVPQKPEKTHVQHLAQAYQAYKSANGATPPSEKAFKSFLASLPPERARAFGLEGGNVDALFVSPRDGKPYAVSYAPPVGGAPIIHEQEGKAGKRYLARPTGQVEEVDEARFRQLVPQ